MADKENDAAYPPLNDNKDKTETMRGYKMRQCGCLWYLYILVGMLYI